MGENSSIEWCDHTFNPWLGCTKVSEGCKHCYAETLMDKRYGRVQWGPQGKRIRTSAENWKKPLAWNRKAEKAGKRARVFCASLADVFEDKADQPEMDEWRLDLLRLIVKTPHLDWLLLTKRPENVMGMVPWIKSPGTLGELPYAGGGFPANVWIGTSVENQEQADKRIPELLAIPAKVRFLSIEPLLEQVDLSEFQPFLMRFKDGFLACRGILSGHIDWVIVGGESGSDARRFDLSWAYSIKNQCQSAGIPVFIKQFGNNPTSVQYGYTITGKGGNWDEWPEDLRIREFPND